ncbi:class I SAM-dependent methyltransferase [Candidatus Dojkabacteria bacterium]|nr:class I SAM-dependent methyltransferase [Candidatus Dojkabacteria bacterium]
MKNILNEKPTDPLHARYLHASRFIKKSDVKNKNILDIGCGFGWFEAEADRRGASKISSIEVTEKDLETARKYLTDHKFRLQAGSALDLPYSNEEFDTVVAWEVLEHLPRGTEQKMFTEVNRVLKGKSVFYLSTPRLSLFSNILDPAWWLIGHRHYSVDFIKSMAEMTGFKVDELRIIGGWGTILWSLDMYFSKWVLRRRPIFSKKVYEWTDSEFEKDGFMTIYARLIKK